MKMTKSSLAMLLVHIVATKVTIIACKISTLIAIYIFDHLIKIWEVD